MGMEMIGKPEITWDESYKDYQIPSTYSSKGSRSEWIGRHAFNFPDGQYHLHARYLKGEVVWVLSGRASPVCKVAGRCRIVEIKTV